MIYIIGIVWLLVVIWGLNALRKGSKQLKDQNNGIYQDEHESRLKRRKRSDDGYPMIQQYDYDDDCFHESHTL